MQKIFRKIDSQNEDDIEKYIKIRKKSLIEDEGSYNLITYPEEEVDFTVKGYKDRDYLNNFYFLEIDKKIIGYVGCHQSFFNKIQTKHNFNIGPIYIDSDYRGKGYGKFILNSLIDHIQKKFNFPKINFFLLVNKNSNIPYNLYKSVLFEEIGIKKNYICTRDGKYIDVISMSKSI